MTVPEFPDASDLDACRALQVAGLGGALMPGSVQSPRVDRAAVSRDTP